MSFNNTPYILRPKHSQMEPAITGRLYQTTLYVGYSVGKMQQGEFAVINPEGSVWDPATDATIIEPTLAPAKSHNLKKLSGIIYKTSRRDQYGRIDDFSNEEYLYTRGPREDVSIGLMKEGVITISHERETKYKHFFTVNTPNVPIEECQVGQIVTDGTDDFVVSRHTYNADGTVNEVFGFDKNDLATEIQLSGPVTAYCMLDKPIYRAFNAAHVLPFTTVRDKNADGKYEQVGYIESAIAVRINLHYGLK